MKTLRIIAIFKIMVVVTTMILATSTFQHAHAQAGACVDTDGDGYGWNGVATCFPNGSGDNNSDNSTAGACVDTDGDGYGWNGVASCTPGGSDNNNNDNSSAGACVDTDGDGYGWNGVASCTPGGSDDGDSRVVTFDDVTEVILMSGQSNAVNSYNSAVISTGTNPNKTPIGADSVDPNIIVWLPDVGQWRPANLCTQRWSTRGNYPRNGGVCANKTIFHIAKRLRQQRGGKIAIISTGLPGLGISEWADKESQGIQEIKDMTDDALKDFSWKRINLIAWSQGERDIGEYRSYGQKLQNLVALLRNPNESGVSYAQNTVFIAQEISNQIDKVDGSCTAVKPNNTPASTFNQVIQTTMNSDGDSSTAWIPAETLATVACSDVHFNASSIRELGTRFADEYLSIVGR